MRTFISIYNRASVGGSGPTFMSQDGMSSRILYASTNNLWFNCCTIGIHQRMGDIWMSDKATSRYIIRASLKICEDMWMAAEGGNYGRIRAVRAECIVIIGYFAALRGEEIGKAYLGSKIKYWNKGMGHPDNPRVPLMLSSRFKWDTKQKLFF